MQAELFDAALEWKTAATAPSADLELAHNLPETAAEMVRRKSDATLAVIPDCGHAPALMDHAQIALVRDWLART